MRRLSRGDRPMHERDDPHEASVNGNGTGPVDKWSVLVDMLVKTKEHVRFFHQLSQMVGDGWNHLLSEPRVKERLALLRADEPVLYESSVLLLMETARPARWRDWDKDIEERASHLPGKSKALITTTSNVEAQQVTWLWWPYLALGTVSMLDGDPGIGKSLLTLQLAANLSRAWPLPDQQGRPTLPTGEAAATLLLTSEDSLSMTIRPRLDQAQANCALVHVMTGWEDHAHARHPFTLQQIPMLADAIERTEPRLVILDPIQAYLGKIDMHRANEVRPLMDALGQVAQDYGCAILCVRHPSKPGQHISKAIHRGMGSADFMNFSRTALFVEEHPMDRGKAVLCHVKSNLGPLGRTQVFSKYDGAFAWCGVSRMTSEMIAGSGRGPDPNAFLKVCFWLEEHMEPNIPENSKTFIEVLKEA